MVKEWVGSPHCNSRAHCAACLGIDFNSVQWRELMRNPPPAKQPESWAMLDETTLSCPYRVTLKTALNRKRQSQANAFVKQHKPFLDRVSLDVARESIDEYVSLGQLPKEVGETVKVLIGL